MTQTARIAAVVTIVAVVAAVAYYLTAGSTITIKQIKSECPAHHAKKVTLSGRLTDKFQIPFYEKVSAWKINDDTGQIWVISQLGAPSSQPRYEVNGTVVDGHQLGDDLVASMDEGRAKDLAKWLVPKINKVIDWLSDACFILENERAEE